MRPVRIGCLAVSVLMTLSACGDPQRAEQSSRAQRAAKTLPPQTAVEAVPSSNVEIVDFSFTSPHVRPGESQVARMTVRNSGTATVAVIPWAIHLYTGNRTLATGQQTNVPAGTSFIVTARWTVAAGTYKVQGYIDPTSKILKNSAPLTSQTVERNLSVPEITGYDVGSDRCVRPGDTFIVQGIGFGERRGRKVHWGGHGAGGELHVNSWSDETISVTMPASATPQRSRFYYAGLQANQAWVSNIDRSFRIC